MKPTLILSPLDVLRASKLAGSDHHIVKLTAAGAACDRCKRLLDVVQQAAPCPDAPPEIGLDPVPGAEHRLRVGPA